MPQRPIENSMAVTSAPRATSRQRRTTSGSTLKTAPKSSEAVSSDTSISLPLSSAATAGTNRSVNASAARSTTPSSSETSSTKPIASTTVSDSRRFFAIAKRLLRFGRAVTPQIAFSEDCICPNTVVAPASSAATPSSEGSRPDSSMRERATACSTATAASRPISTRPITDTAMMTTGASENSV